MMLQRVLTSIILFAALAPVFSSRCLAERNSTLSSGTISVGDKKLFYTDSGVPSGRSRGSYTTVFLLHGLSANSGIFSKTQSTELRFVALNRRGYRGSTPYSTAEFGVILNGTMAQRDTFLVDRGVEIAVFIDNFLQLRKILTGDVAIVGWSAGNMFTLATLSSVSSWPAAVKSRLAPRIQALIMQEPSAEILGFASHPDNWLPLIDTSMRDNTRGAMTVQWASAYFKHGDFTRDPNTISWVVPSISRTPSIFSMSAAQYDSIVEIGAASEGDLAVLGNFNPQLRQSYHNAILGNTVKAAFPKLKKSFFTGDVTVSFGPYAYFLVKNNTSAARDYSVTFRVVPGVNHFINWDEPGMAVQTYLQLA